MNKRIEKITELFFQFGIKSVSMNDIARALGLSKKKLYQIFTDKTEIIEKVIQAIKLKIERIENECYSSEINAIKKEIHQRKKYLELSLKIKPTFIYDLRKFYPAIFNVFISIQKNQVIRSCCNSIVEGKEQGLYREDLDPDFISKLSVTLMCSILHPDLNEISESDLMSKEFSDQFFIYHMNGICTEKGRKVFNELIRAELI